MVEYSISILARGKQCAQLNEHAIDSLWKLA